MPDGTIIKNVPEGTTKAQLMAKLDRSRRIEMGGAGGDVPSITYGPAPSIPPEPGFIDQLMGAGEVGASMLTGATGGLAGMVGGGLSEAASQGFRGQFGSPQAADAIERQALESAGQFTYAPRTQAGQQMMRDMQPVLGVLPPIIGAGGMMTPPRVRPQLPQMRRPQQPAGLPGSVGASQVAADMARAATAESMPVPFTGESALTKGQRSRDFMQLQFEKEAAKLAEAGAPLRERMENQRQTLVSNFDELLERQRPAAVEPREIGATVDAAVRARKRQVSADVREAYTQARQAGEMQEPTSIANLGPLFDELTDFEGLAGAEAINASKMKAVKMGIANLDDDGNLVFSDAVPIDRVETFRQFVNDASDVSVPRSSMIRRKITSALDEATEGKGGPLYQRARQKAAAKFREFDRSRLAKQILGTKRGSDERTLALENIAQDVIVNAPLDELQKLRGTLLRAGGSGKQAWQDLKAYGISHIMKKAFGRQIGESGAAISTPATFLRAIEKFDDSGKLQALYGKRQAQIMRDLAELTRILETAPPGAVNHSNTSSAAVNAVVEMGLTASLTGVPAPMLATIRTATRFVKNKALANRIHAALKN